MSNSSSSRNERTYDALHDRAMCLPSLHDLKAVVKLPQDSTTHMANLEKAYADARSIIVGLLDLAPRSETVAHSDTQRMDWLERMAVEVRQPAVWGSHELFIAAPTDTDGDEEPSNIRKQIDYQRNGGTKP